MAAVQNPGVPKLKVENAHDGNIKSEAIDQDVDMTSPYADDEDDGLEDGGDLDFTNVQQHLWLAQIPRSLWNTLSTIGMDEEIELGTIRIEGSQDNPQRISLKLNPLQAFQTEHKEYQLNPPPPSHLRAKTPGSALLFSEQDLPTYRPKQFSWEAASSDNAAHGRSTLYETNKRAAKRKENNGRFEPYTRKSIPKKTALHGTVVRELEAIPVKNAEYAGIQRLQDELAFHQAAGPQARFFPTEDHLRAQKIGLGSYMATADQRKAVQKLKHERRQKQLDARAPIMTEQQLMHSLFELFKEYRYWGINSLRMRTGRQPQEFFMQTVRKVAEQQVGKDLMGKWGLKAEYLEGNLQVGGVAPEGVESEIEGGSGVDEEDEEDDEEGFEDVEV